ncbi:MAG: GNAT family N-acetyltransferase [Nitrososphaerales archaeon]
MSEQETRIEFAKLLLKNEQAFHQLFSALRKYDSFSLLHNRLFAEDPVFNHFVVDESVLNNQSATEESLRKIVEELKTASSSLGFRTTVFVEKIWRKFQQFEKVAIGEGYRITERMEILSKPLEEKNPLKVEPGVQVSETRDFELWNRLFMDAFKIPPSWEEELLHKNQELLEDKAVTLFLGKESESKDAAQGCLLSFVVPRDLMGIYAVGTDSKWRGRGIARAMMSFAEERARQIGCKYMTLQTMSSDGVSPMYKKMGYATEFERDILWHPLSG